MFCLMPDTQAQICQCPCADAGFGHPDCDQFGVRVELWIMEFQGALDRLVRDDDDTALRQLLHTAHRQLKPLLDAMTNAQVRHTKWHSYYCSYADTEAAQIPSRHAGHVACMNFHCRLLADPGCICRPSSPSAAQSTWGA